MKKKEDDIDDFDFSDEDAFKKRFRRVSEAELPEPIRKMREAARSKLGSRVTTYFDADIEDFKNDLLNDKEFLRKLKTALAA